MLFIGEFRQLDYSTSERLDEQTVLRVKAVKVCSSLAGGKPQKFDLWHKCVVLVPSLKRDSQIDYNFGEKQNPVTFKETSF